MNSINRIQNEGIQLDRLAAQRHLYSVAKKIFGWQIIVAFIFSILWSFVLVKWPNSRPYVALWSVIAGIVELALLSWQKSLRERAAKIQELFDCDVLQLPWKALKAGSNLEAELISHSSTQLKSTDPNVTRFRN